MNWTEAACLCYGPRFSPAKAAQSTGLVFEEQNEPGEIGKLGRYQGKPLPYGSSKVVPPRQRTKSNAKFGIEWLVDTVTREKGHLETAGVSKITLSLNVYHDGQCDLEFTPTLVGQIAASGMILILSCYEDAEYVHKMMAVKGSVL